MKKLFGLLAVAVLMATAGLMTSCEPVQNGDVLFSVEVSFDDNMDLLTSSIDKGFEDAGFTHVSGHTWKLRGELNASKRKATEVFQNRCKAIDKDRTLIPSIGRYLALKGEKATLYFQYDAPKPAALSEYTFVENDLVE